MRRYKRDGDGKFAAGSTTVQQDGGKDARNSKNKKDLKRRLSSSVGGGKPKKGRTLRNNELRENRTKRVVSALEKKSRAKYLRKRRGKRKKRG